MTILSHLRTRPVWLILALFAAPTTLGCLDEMDTGEDEQELFGNRSYFWPGHGSSRVDIDVCWENPADAPGFTAQLKAQYREGVRTAVESSWGRYARINFYGWDGIEPLYHPAACTAGAPGIHVRICNLPTDPLCPALPDSQSLGGYPNVNGASNGIRLNPTYNSWNVVHEFGHALGWYHEEERTGQASCEPQTAANSSPIYYGGYDETSVMSYCNPQPNPIGAPWLSPNDIAATQRVYGRRIPGSIVSPRAHCVSAHYDGGVGQDAFLWDCDEYGDDQEFRSHWSYKDRFHLELSGSAGGRCLAAAGTASGSPVKLATCTASSNWYLRDIYLRGFGGLCMDLKDGNTWNGTPIQVWKCGALGGANQKWRRRLGGLIEFGSSGKCVRAMDNKLVLWTCEYGDPAEIFNFSNGTIRPDSNNTKCLDVQGPSDAQYINGQGLPQNGARVQLNSCNGSMNQQWNFSGQLRYGPNQGVCLTRSGGDAASAALTVAQCASLDSQLWDYYFNL